MCSLSTYLFAVELCETTNSNLTSRTTENLRDTSGDGKFRYIHRESAWTRSPVFTIVARSDRAPSIVRSRQRTRFVYKFAVNICINISWRWGTSSWSSNADRYTEYLRTFHPDICMVRGSLTNGYELLRVSVKRPARSIHVNTIIRSLQHLTRQR